MSELTFEDYLRNLSEHPDAGVRANAAWRLGRTRDHRCLMPLLHAAADPSAAVRARVMEALGSRREPEITPAIAQGLYDMDEDVRAMAARAAALVASTELTPRLYELLDDPSERVLEETIQALAYSDDESVGPRLVDVLILHADNDTLRYFTRQALMQRGGDATVEAIATALSNPQTPLAIIGDTLEVLAHIRAKSTRPLIDALTHHPDELIRETARWALSQL